MERNTLSRRQFLAGTIGKSEDRIFPPGLLIAHLSSCTACGECIDACPTQIISLNERTPELNFKTGECTFCGKCASICPEYVFSDEAVTAFNHVVVFEGNCLALNRVDCQACRDACPNAAIRFRPVRGGPFVPELSSDDCTDCGACIAICPVDAVATQPRLPVVRYA